MYYYSSIKCQIANLSVLCLPLCVLSGEVYFRAKGDRWQQCPVSKPEPDQADTC